jgi:hypothetical protein
VVIDLIIAAAKRNGWNRNPSKPQRRRPTVRLTVRSRQRCSPRDVGESPRRAMRSATRSIIANSHLSISHSAVAIRPDLNQLPIHRCAPLPCQVAQLSTSSAIGSRGRYTGIAPIGCRRRWNHTPAVAVLLAILIGLDFNTQIGVPRDVVHTITATICNLMPKCQGASGPRSPACDRR